MDSEYEADTRAELLDYFRHRAAADRDAVPRSEIMNTFQQRTAYGRDRLGRHIPAITVNAALDRFVDDGIIEEIDASPPEERRYRLADTAADLQGA